MKKVLAIVLTLAVLSVASVTAFAASPIIAKGGSDAFNVTGTYVAGSAAATHYSVDVTWGSMEFTYTDASAGTWNPETHEYDGAVAAGWSCAQDANKITVTNHSNADVTVAFSYAPEAGNAIVGSFSEPELTLNSAVGTAVADAPTDSTTLELTGALSSENTAGTKIGTVTVTLTDR